MDTRDMEGVTGLDTGRQGQDLTGMSESIRIMIMTI